MKSVDGDVRLSADINIEPAEKKIRKLASDATSILNVKGKGTKGVEDGFTRAINKANEFKQVASSINVDTKMQALENKVKDAGDALSLAKTKLEQFNKSRPHTKEYDTLTQKIKEGNAELRQLYEIAPRDSAGNILGGWDERIDNVRRKLSELAETRRNLVTSGAAFETDTAKQEQLSNAVDKASRAYELAKAKLQGYANSQQSSGAAASSATEKTTRLKSALSKLASGASKVKTAFSKISSVLSKVGNVFKSLASKARAAFNAISKHSRSSSKSASSSFANIGNTVKHGLRNILKYALGIRSLFFLFRKLRNAAKEGFKNLGGYSDSFNKTVSDLLSATAKLKNAFAAAFQPIASVVIPILTKFVNYLSAALNKLGEFFAALTGQEYVYQAVDTTVEYVEDETKKTVKKIQKYTSPLDDLNIYGSNKQDTSDTDSGVDPKTMFKTVPISDAIKNLVDKIKAILKSEDWSEIGRMIGEKLNEALRKIDWSKIISEAKKLAKRLATLLNGFIAAVDWTLVGTTIANAIRTGLEFAYTFLKTFDFSKLGKAIGDLINGAISVYNASLFAKTLSAWVIGIFTTLYNLVSTIDWGKISDAIIAFISNVDYNKMSATVVNFLFAFARALSSIKFTAIGEAFRGGLKKINWKGIWNGVVNIITNALKGITDFFGLKGVDTSNLRKALKDIFEVAKELLKALSQLLKAVIVPTVNNLLPAIVKLVGAVFKALTPIIKALTPISKTVTKVAAEIVDSLAPVLPTIGKLVANILEILGPIVQQVVEVIGQIVKSLAPALNGILKITNFLVTTTKPIAPLLQMIAGVVQVIFMVVGKLLEPLEWIGNAVENIFGSLTGNDEEPVSGKLQTEVDNLKTVSEDLRVISDNIDQTITAVDESIQQTQGDLGYIDELKNRMDQLLSKSTLTPQEMEELNTIADLLSEKLPEFKNTWDSMVKKNSDGTYSLTKSTGEVKQSIDGIINKLKQQYAVEAMHEQYVELYRQQATAQAELSGKVEKVKQAKQELNKAEQEEQNTQIAINAVKEEYNRETDKSSTRATELKNKLDKLTIEHDKQKKAVNTAKTALNEANKEYLVASGKVGQLQAKSTQLNTAVRVLTGSYDKNKEGLQGLRDAYDLGLISEEELKKNFNITKKELFKGTKAATAGVREGIKAGVDKGADELTEAGEDIGEDVIKGAYKELKIHSPSKVFSDDFVPAITAGINKGIDKNIQSCVTKMQQAMDLIINAAKKKTKAFETLFDFLPKTFKKVFESVRSTIKNILNGILSDLEKFINNSIAGLNQLISGINTVNKAAAGKTGKYTTYSKLGNIAVPRLAMGAVIPPNREFLAVLGDQRKGNNIETPESLLRQILREERGDKQYNVNVQIGSETLFKIVLDEAKLKQTQTGHSPFELVY